MLAYYFIDVGIGLNREQGIIGGTLRTTYYPVEEAQKIVDKKLAPMADYPDDVYRTNIQISELNALNASIAVLKYKQVRVSIATRIGSTICCLTLTIAKTSVSRPILG